MRLATFNILHGRSLSDDRVDLERFAAAVRALGADVLGLQEVDRGQPRSGGADLAAVAAEAMGATEYRFAAALCGTPGTWVAADGREPPGSAAYGVALVSRYPVRSWGVLRVAPAPFRVPRPRFADRTLEMVRDEPRVAVAATMATPAGPMTIVNTHLSFLRWWNGRQLRRLRRSLGALATPVPGPILMVGDLNMGTARAERLTAMSSLHTEPTFPGRQPLAQLDHILGPADLRERVVGGRTHEVPLSDHRALSVDLR
jgi:endonuclease/exonuclease/phosphatase family metal-dependent hydrolase